MFGMDQVKMKLVNEATRIEEDGRPRHCREWHVCVTPSELVEQKSPSKSAVFAASVMPEAPASIIGMDPETLYRLFPFNFALDLELNLVQAGAGLRKACPQMANGFRADQALQASEILADCVVQYLRTEQSALLRIPFPHCLKARSIAPYS